MEEKRKKKMTLGQKHLITGWLYLLPAAILIFVFSFYPIVRAFIMSLEKGVGQRMTFTGFTNYARIFKDKIFVTTLGNTFLYLIIQVPVMLILALVFASLLNNRNLRFKGLFRTCIFLPCATSLVSYSMLFRSMFANDGYQHRAPEDFMVYERVVGTVCHHHGSDLALDRLQHGLLSRRPSEH